jgi:hypothetical protein
VLVEIGRHQAPVLAATVDQPVFLIQGISSNALGRPTILEWMAVTGLPHRPSTEPVTQELLTRYGLSPRMPGRATPRDLPTLTKLVPAAIEEARRHLGTIEGGYRRQVEATLAPYRQRVNQWKQEALFAGPRPDRRSIDSTADRLLHLVTSLETVGEPMLRLLAVLEPHSDTAGDTEG